MYRIIIAKSKMTFSNSNIKTLKMRRNNLYDHRYHQSYLKSRV